MGLDLQTVFNVACALVAALGGFLMRVLWESMRQLQEKDAQLAEKVHSIETIVAGQYVAKDEFNRVADAIFRKLDRIEEKVDGKADKTKP